MNLPSGIVTFLFTDIEGSTRLAQEHPEAMPALLSRHHAILNQAIAARSGLTFNIVGDSFAVAFQDAGDALAAALDIQQALYEEAWAPAPVKVRMGLHTGPAQLLDAADAQRYTGYTTIATTQRIMSAGHGGQILLSQMTADPTRDTLPAGVHLMDMKERRLKDITQPVHLYQVATPGLPSEFPPLKTAELTRHNLPSQITPFVGRESELDSLAALLSDESNRLITLVAPGGMGKTRLSLEVASRLVEDFPQGLYFVALDRLNSADLIVQTLAAVLPISLSSNEDSLARVVEYLSDKRIFLVMDNFEHVLEGVPIVGAILRAAPQVRILATSRVRLSLRSEIIFNMDGLTTDETNLMKNSAIQLFAQIARQLQPDFSLNRTTLPAVTRICRLVDGMPLAIVLAAAWIDPLSVDEIAAEIETSLDILETEMRDMPARQRSVRAVIESSWSQVDPFVQTLQQRLSVFRGGFTRTAAQEATGATLRALSQLVDRALLRRDPDTGRFSIHELLRQYAEEQLRRSPDDELAAHAAHAAYYGDLMTRCSTNLHADKLPEALLEIDHDIDNIRIAWNYWAVRQVAGQLNRILDAWWIFFEIRGAFAPAIRLFDDAARHLVIVEADVVCMRATVQARQAWFSALIGLPHEGLKMAQESIATLRCYGQDVPVNTLDSLTINAIFLNRFEIVIETAREMIARAERSGGTWERGWALIWQAYALVMQNQIGAALEIGQEALSIFELLDNPFGLSVASGIILGFVTLAMGDIRAAKGYFTRGAQMAESINYLRLLQITYDNLGAIALLETDIPEARQFFIKSLRVSKQCGQMREMLASLRDLASIQLAQGDPAGALRLLAVVLNHPASDQNSLNRPERLRDEAEKIRAQIGNQLDSRAYQSAWESGQALHIAEVVGEILS